LPDRSDKLASLAITGAKTSWQDFISELYYKFIVEFHSDRMLKVGQHLAKLSKV